MLSCDDESICTGLSLNFAKTLGIYPRCYSSVIYYVNILC